MSVLLLFELISVELARFLNISRVTVQGFEMNKQVRLVFMRVWLAVGADL